MSPYIVLLRANLAARFFIALQHVLPQHAISRLVNAVTRSQTIWFKNLLIRTFIHSFKIDLSDYVKTNPCAFTSFNEFFTRALRLETRPLPFAADALACPVDGTVSEIGRIEGHILLQAKGRHYTLEALLAQRSEWTKKFIDGHFLTIYLAPYNYHRIHMAVNARLSDAWYVPGRLFSVNRTTADGVANLFSRNERIAFFFENTQDTAQSIQHALLLIGAINVGCMETIWHGQVTPSMPRQLTQLPTSANSIDFNSPLYLTRGDEMGRFNMGSTIILLFPKDTIEWDATLHSGTVVRMGQTIGKLRQC